MSEKRCKHCNEILQEDEKYCLFCGEKQEEPIIIELENKLEDTTQVNPKKTKKIMIYSIILLVSIGLITYGLMTNNNLYLAIGVLGLPVMFYVLIELYKVYDRRIIKNKKLDTIEQLIGILVVFLFFFGRTFLSNLLNEHRIKPDAYNFEIEQGYETLETITSEEMQDRLTKHLKEFELSLGNIDINPIDQQFIINIEVYVNRDRFLVGYVTRSIVDNMTRDYDTYAYTKELNIDFIDVDEVFAQTRLYNLFLIDVVDLEKDGVYYDKENDMTVLFKTSQERNFDFTTVLEELGKDPESTTRYPQAYEEWNKEFLVITDNLYQNFNEANLQFGDEGIEPSVSELRDLDYLTQQLGSKCESFKKMSPNYYYEVFHQGFSRACQFIHKAYVNNLDGLKNKSVDRIEYSFIDYNLAYDWLTKLFELSDEEVGDNA